jgi:hypothetical protein
MLNSIATGLKMDVPRSFIIFFVSFAIMSTFSILKYFVGDSLSRIVLYVPFFIYCFYYLKVFTLLSDFKSVLNESNSFDAFNKAYAAYIERKDYLKFRKVTIFLIGWATLDLFWIFTILTA